MSFWRKLTGRAPEPSAGVSKVLDSGAISSNSIWNDELSAIIDPLAAGLQAANDEIRALPPLQRLEQALNELRKLAKLKPDNDQFSAFVETTLNVIGGMEAPFDELHKIWHLHEEEGAGVANRPVSVPAWQGIAEARRRAKSAAERINRAYALINGHRTVNGPKAEQATADPKKSIDQFAAWAIRSSARGTFNASQIADVIIAIRKELRDAASDINDAELDSIADSLLIVRCPKCGTLTEQAVQLLVIGGTGLFAGTAFAGPNASALHSGQCVQCGGRHFDLSFSNEKIRDKVDCASSPPPRADRYEYDADTDMLITVDSSRLGGRLIRSEYHTALVDAQEFWSACREGRIDTVLHLLKKGEKGSSYDAATEHVIIQKGRVYQDIKTLDGFTGLYLASQNGHADVVWWLLGNGAGTEFSDRSNGYTPLIVAIVNGHAEAVDSILRYGLRMAILDKQDRAGLSALMHAARSGRTDIVRSLIKHGAGLNIASAVDGATALSMATESGCEEVVAELLRAELVFRKVGDALSRILTATEDTARLRQLNVLKEMGEESLAPLLREAFAEFGDPTTQNINVYKIGSSGNRVGDFEGS